MFSVKVIIAAWFGSIWSRTLNYLYVAWKLFKRVVKKLVIIFFTLVCLPFIIVGFVGSFFIIGICLGKELAENFADWLGML